MFHTFTLFILFSALFQVVAAQGDSLGLFIIYMVVLGLFLAGTIWLVATCVFRVACVGYIESSPESFKPYRRSLGTQIGCTAIWWLLPCFGFMWIRKVRDVLPIKKSMQIVHCVSTVLAVIFLVMTIALFTTNALETRFSQDLDVKQTHVGQTCATCPAGLWMANPTCFHSTEALESPIIFGETTSTLVPTPIITDTSAIGTTTGRITTDPLGSATASTGSETFVSTETSSTSTTITAPTTASSSPSPSPDEAVIVTEFNATAAFDQPLTLLSDKDASVGTPWAAACFQQCLKSVSSFEELYEFWGDEKVPIAKQLGFNSSSFERRSSAIVPYVGASAGGRVGLFRSGNNDVTLVLDGYALIEEDLSASLGDMSLYVSTESCDYDRLPNTLPAALHPDLLAKFQLTTNNVLQDQGYRHRVTAVAVAKDMRLLDGNVTLSVVFTKEINGETVAQACAPLDTPSENELESLDKFGYWSTEFMNIFSVIIFDDDVIFADLPMPLRPLPLPETGPAFCDCQETSPLLRARGHTENENADTISCTIERAILLPRSSNDTFASVFRTFYVLIFVIGFILNCVFWISAFVDLKGGSGDFNELKSAE